MKVLIVDDEPLARRRLARLLAEAEGVTVCGEAGDAAEALERVRGDRPDLLLLDIAMPGLSGLELAARESALPPVVFTTAYDQYALQAFEVSAVDYLLKPVEPERLAAAIEKARARRAGGDVHALHSLLERLERRAQSEPPPRLQARSGGTTRLLDAAAVTRIHASEKYALVRHEGRELVLDESLNTLETRLEPHGFFRAHRAELVNLAHVRALTSEDGATRVELSDGQTASVSRRSLATLKRRLGIR